MPTFGRRAFEADTTASAKALRLVVCLACQKNRKASNVAGAK